MDIDSPPGILPDPHAGHNHLTLPPFSASFPLPFRVLFLIGLAQLLWASNLHILHLLGLDTSWILDFRDDLSPDALLDHLDDTSLEMNGLHPENRSISGLRLDSSAGLLVPDTPTRTKSFGLGRVDRPDSGRLYGPVYKLFGLYTAWVGGGWVVFRLLTGAESERMEAWRGWVGVVAVGAIVGGVAPWQGVGQRERTGLRRAMKRIFMPPLTAPIFFCDVVLADILTSFAKVLGDLWISACQIWLGGITRGRVAQSGWANWVTLTMVSLPYILRFRQCALEYYQSSFTSSRPLANALKYFSAFPVILLSAAQKWVVMDIASQKGITVQELGDTGDRWFGEHRLFRLWLLAVIVNSMFSFYWDVEMDWGLALCEVDSWLGHRPSENGLSAFGTAGRNSLSRRNSDLTLVGKIKRLLTKRPAVAHQRSPAPTPSLSMSSAHSVSPDSQPSRFFAFGLRPTLLLPDPLVYHLFAVIDIILRFTWSLKLSSHLHTISEIESGVFIMEALELVRRWMWVFVRVEWEAVKKGEMARFGRREATTGQVIWKGEERDEDIA